MFLLLFEKSAETMTGTTADVIRVSRQMLNRSIASRTIPKQECMVELAELPLVLSSDTTETINLSGSYKIKSDTHRDLVSQYRKIAKSNPTMSLHDYVRKAINEKKRSVKNGKRKYKNVIPHYVGANGQPKYPPTKEYAMAIFIVHKPWEDSKPKRRNGAQDWIDEFKEFVTSEACPEFVKMEYARVKERAESKRPSEAISSEECYDYETQADVDDSTKDLLNIITTQTLATDLFLNVHDQKINKGLHYDWSERMSVSHLYLIYFRRIFNKHK